MAYRMEEKNGPVPPEPGPSFPIPIPWLPTEPSSVLRPVRGSTGPVEMMRGSHADPSTLSGSLLRPNPREVSRAPAAQLGLTVLLVDDNHHHRKPLIAALRDQGHTVLHAADGVSGEALCRAFQREIDVLVACADMKRMCGFELARRVVAMRPDIGVLLMWRHFEGPEAAHSAYERGYAVIEEPFTPEELCSRLTGLSASPRDASAERRRDNEDRLIAREDEVFITRFNKEN